MRKVLVIGCSGAGKSTLARRLGEILKTDVIHLDSHYWHPGWVETPKEAWPAVVETLLAGDSWVMDGNYSGTLEMRLDACDTVIFLDVHRVICLWRVIKRAVLNRNRTRADMAEGCPEKVDWDFIRWVWGYPERSRPRVIELLERRSGEKQIIRLRSQAEVTRFLEGICPGAEGLVRTANQE